MNLNGRRTVQEALAQDIKGGVVLKDATYWKQTSATMLFCAKAIAAWPDVSDVIEELRSEWGDTPTPLQQSSLTALGALALAQVCLRDTIAEAKKTAQQEKSDG